MKNYTENHQKSRSFNIFLLTSSIFRGLRSAFFKTFFLTLYQKYIREFVFKKLLRYLFFFKHYLGVDCGVHPPPTRIWQFLTLLPIIGLGTLTESQDKQGEKYISRKDLIKMSEFALKSSYFGSTFKLKQLISRTSICT